MTTVSRRVTIYGSIYALSADGFSYAELKDHADQLRQRLLKVKDVSKVAIFGAQDEKVFVEISQQRLAQLGLDFNQVLAQLGQQNAIESGGTINAPTDSIQVRVAGQFTSLDELRADGGRDHGWPDRRHRAHAVFAARDVRHLVPHQGRARKLTGSPSAGGEIGRRTRFRS